MTSSLGLNEPTPEEWSEEDGRALERFVVQVQELMQAIVDNQKHIPKDLRDEVKASWEHARADLDRLHDAIQLLRQDEPGSDQAGMNADRRKALREHGLTGVQRRTKLRAWRARLFRFGRPMDRPWLRSLLRWTDTILESLVDAMTLGAAGKEFKQSLENFLADADADETTRSAKATSKPDH